MKNFRPNGYGYAVVFAAMLGVLAAGPVLAVEPSATEAAKTKGATAVTEKKSAAPKHETATATSQEKAAPAKTDQPAPNANKEVALSNEVLEKLKLHLDRSAKSQYEIYFIGMLVIVGFVWLGVLSFAYFHNISKLLATLDAMTRAINEGMSGLKQPATVGAAHPLSPGILTISPRHGAKAGGYEIIVTGENYDAQTRVSIGGQRTSQEQISGSNSIRLRVPPATASGWVDVEVINGLAISFSRPKCFLYVDPLRLDGPEKVSSGTVQLTLAGQGFYDGLQVEVDGNAAQARYVSETAMEVTLPTKAQAGDVLAIKVQNAISNEVQEKRVSVQ